MIRRMLDKVKRVPPVPLLIVLPVFTLVLLFQNCAPAPLHSGDQTASNSGPMSKVLVHLDHDEGITLSDVELVADDVMREISIVGVSKAASTTALTLELPLGAEQLIVARAKYYDPVSNKIATYYGNAVVNLDNVVGEVTIQMVALP